MFLAKSPSSKPSEDSEKVADVWCCGELHCHMHYSGNYLDTSFSGRKPHLSRSRVALGLILLPSWGDREAWRERIKKAR